MTATHDGTGDLTGDPIVRRHPGTSCGVRQRFSVIVNTRMFSLNADQKSVLVE